MALHRAQVAAENHVVQRWEVANATARNSLSVVAADIGGYCYQQDTKDFYVLCGVSPMLWKLTTASAVDRRNVTSVSSIGGVLTIDYSQGDFHKIVLTENITSIVFSNLLVTNMGMTLWLDITQDAAVARTVTWPASFKWGAGTPGVISPSLGARDILALTSIDAGTKWDATLSNGRA